MELSAAFSLAVGGAVPVTSLVDTGYIDGGTAKFRMGGSALGALNMESFRGERYSGDGREGREALLEACGKFLFKSQDFELLISQIREDLLK